MYFFCFSVVALGQSKQLKMKCDSVFTINYGNFSKIVDESLKLLEKKKLELIKISEHQKMIRAYNTIWITQNNDSRLKASKFQSLEKLMGNPEYIRKMLKVFPKWVPNRGMGIYFNALNVELGGTPCSWSIYKIK